MTITVNSTLPTGHILQYIDTKTNEPASLKLKDLYKGTFILVGVPASFSPTCSEQHLPSFLDQLNTFQEKGAKVIVISRDNLFAQRAWAKKFGVDEKQDQVIFTSDVDLGLVKELGLCTKEVEPLGEVSSRFAVIAKDGEVTYIGQEKTVGDVTVSSADSVLKEL